MPSATSAGRGTSASWRTASRRRWCWPTPRSSRPKIWRSRPSSSTPSCPSPSRRSSGRSATSTRRSTAMARTAPRRPRTWTSIRAPSSATCAPRRRSGARSCPTSWAKGKPDKDVAPAPFAAPQASTQAASSAGFFPWPADCVVSAGAGVRASLPDPAKRGPHRGVPASGAAFRRVEHPRVSGRARPPARPPGLARSRQMPLRDRDPPADHRGGRPDGGPGGALVHRLRPGGAAIAGDRQAGRRRRAPGHLQRRHRHAAHAEQVRLRRGPLRHRQQRRARAAGGGGRERWIRRHPRRRAAQPQHEVGLHLGAVRLPHQRRRRAGPDALSAAAAVHPGVPVKRALLLGAALFGCSLRTPPTTAPAACSSSTQCDHSEVCFLGECRANASNLSVVQVEVRPPGNSPFGVIQVANIDLRARVVNDFTLQPQLNAAGPVLQEAASAGVSPPAVAGANVVFTDHAPAIPDRVEQLAAVTDTGGAYSARLPQGTSDLLVRPPAPLPPYRPAPLQAGPPALDLRLPKKTSPVSVCPAGS